MTEIEGGARRTKDTSLPRTALGPTAARTVLEEGTVILRRRVTPQWHTLILHHLCRLYDGLADVHFCSGVWALPCHQEGMWAEASDGHSWSAADFKKAGGAECLSAAPCLLVVLPGAPERVCHRHLHHLSVPPAATPGSQVHSRHVSGHQRAPWEAHRRPLCLRPLRSPPAVLVELGIERPQKVGCVAPVPNDDVVGVGGAEGWGHLFQRRPQGAFVAEALPARSGGASVPGHAQHRPPVAKKVLVGGNSLVRIPATEHRVVIEPDEVVETPSPCMLQRPRSGPEKVTALSQGALREVQRRVAPLLEGHHQKLPSWRVTQLLTHPALRRQPSAVRRGCLYQVQHRPVSGRDTTCDWSLQLSGEFVDLIRCKFLTKPRMPGGRHHRTGTGGNNRQSKDCPA
eukprot:Hpha_TRINITY_DN22707_c0_g1::TRINITY_DN22707_c0_g1_i1::g.34109::m.34109